MTIIQMLVVVLLGPVGFVSLLRGLSVLVHGEGEYNIVEAFILSICVVAILVAFFGVA